MFVLSNNRALLHFRDVLGFGLGRAQQRVQRLAPVSQRREPFVVQLTVSVAESEQKVEHVHEAPVQNRVHSDNLRPAESWVAHGSLSSRVRAANSEKASRNLPVGLKALEARDKR